MAFLKTDGGPHPDSKWADLTAEMLFPTREDMMADKVRDTKRFQIQVADILEPHHSDMVKVEKTKIDVDASHLNTAHDYHAERAQKALDEIVAASKGTFLEEHCANAQWQAVALGLIGDHMASNAHVHRGWHADGNPSNPHCAKFIADRKAQQGEASAV